MLGPTKFLFFIKDDLKGDDALEHKTIRRLESTPQCSRITCFTTLEGLGQKPGSHSFLKLHTTARKSAIDLVPFKLFYLLDRFLKLL